MRPGGRCRTTIFQVPNKLLLRHSKQIQLHARRHVDEWRAPILIDFIRHVVCSALWLIEMKCECNGQQTVRGRDAEKHSSAAPSEAKSAKWAYLRASHYHMEHISKTNRRPNRNDIRISLDVLSIFPFVLCANVVRVWSGLHAADLLHPLLSVVRWKCENYAVFFVCRFWPSPALLSTFSRQSTDDATPSTITHNARYFIFSHATFALSPAYVRQQRETRTEIPELGISDSVLSSLHSTARSSSTACVTLRRHIRVPVTRHTFPHTATTQISI